MNASFELLSKITDYLDHELSLSDLESWVTPRLPIYLTAPGSGLEALVSQLELGLTEISAGILSERTLRRRLALHPGYQSTNWIEATEPEITSSTGTSSDPSGVFMRLGWHDLSQPWSTESQVVNV